MRRFTLIVLVPMSHSVPEECPDVFASSLEPSFDSIVLLRSGYELGEHIAHRSLQILMLAKWTTSNVTAF